MEIFGIRLVGATPENLHKLVLTLAFIAAVLIVRVALRWLARLVVAGRKNERRRFWIHQGVNLTTAALLGVGVLSIWFDDPTRLTTAIGLVTAGLAFALQRVVTSVAGYFVILRSQVFTVGDRILMGNVRGDVIQLGFVQTKIMEMGQPPGERPDDPNVWVKSRQYTGRVVTVTNDKVFENAVYNYTHDFPYLWEEMTIPIAFKDDRRRAEQILLEAAERHTIDIAEIGQKELEEFRELYHVPETTLKPKVYLRITDNWIEMTVRFLARDRGSRELKDAMSRDILAAFDEAGIGIASGTYAVVEFPPIKFEDRAEITVVRRNGA